MDTYQSTCRQIVANSALAQSVLKRPAVLGPDKQCELPVDDGSHQLPIERERQLADDFAFLAATTNDTDRIMAVAIEEDADRMGMHLRLASNTGDLSDVKIGFQGIANILRRAGSSKEHRAVLKDALFREIVRFDLHHILSRIRSRHADRSWKSEKKQTLCMLLQNALQDPSVKPSKKVFKEQLLMARPLAQELKEMADSFDRLPMAAAVSEDGQAVMMDIIKKMALFRQEVKLEKIFPGSRVDPSIVEKLLDESSKICRYLKLSGELIDAARDPKYTVLSNISIETLPEPVVDMGFLRPAPTFDETLARIAPTLSITLPTPLARQEFKRCMKTCPTAGKVHAEMQLLFFYERNRHIRPPRVLCSNKKACYLCHLFITSHGRFGVPKTHGKLYAGWVLPKTFAHEDDTKLRVATEVFKNVLETQIRQILLGGAPRHRAPNESDIGFDGAWSPRSTVLSVKANGGGSIHDAQQPSTHVSRRASPSVGLPGPSAPLKSHPLSQGLVPSATSSRATLRPQPLPTPPSDVDDGPPTPTAPVEHLEQAMDSERGAPRPAISPSLSRSIGNLENEAPTTLALELLEPVDRNTVEPVDGNTVEPVDGNTVEPVDRNTVEPVAVNPLPTEAIEQRTVSSFAPTRVPPIIDLARGANHRIDLAPPSFSAHARSKIMNLSLSWDGLPSVANSDALLSPAMTQKRLATVRWLDPQEHQRLQDAYDIDMAGIEPGREQTHAVGQDGLRLWWKGSVVSVKFELEAA